ncbi:MAG: hypothetical protein LBK60_03200 [Verrucomicrobiales bacterium]|jgi:hypothetical protein|nr:hypothetical protein [Verrucomicrobiales bacterium]
MTLFKNNDGDEEIEAQRRAAEQSNQREQNRAAAAKQAKGGYAGPEPPKYGFEAFLEQELSKGRLDGQSSGANRGRLLFKGGPFAGMDVNQARQAARKMYAGMPDEQRQQFEDIGADKDIRSERDLAAKAEYEKKREAFHNASQNGGGYAAAGKDGQPSESWLNNAINGAKQTPTGGTAPTSATTPTVTPTNGTPSAAGTPATPTATTPVTTSSATAPAAGSPPVSPSVVAPGASYSATLPKAPEANSLTPEQQVGNAAQVAAGQRLRNQGYAGMSVAEGTIGDTGVTQRVAAMPSANGGAGTVVGIGKAATGRVPASADTVAKLAQARAAADAAQGIGGWQVATGADGQPIKGVMTPKKQTAYAGPSPSAPNPDELI